MEGPQQKRQKREPWTTEEDNKLKHYKTLFPNGSWKEIMQKAKLDRSVKSVSHRWENYLKSDFNRAGFSEKEDNIIINLMSLYPDRAYRHWKFLANVLGRSPNDIKNYWNNHLKKKKRQETTSDPDRLAEIEAQFKALI